MTVGKFQHAGQHAALYAAGDLHAAKRRTGRSVHHHAEFRVLVIFFAAEAFCVGPLSAIIR